MMDDREFLQREMTRELRAARIMILIVAFLTFGIEMVYAFVLKMPTGLADVPPEFAYLRTALVAIAAGFLIAFLALWYFAKTKPKLCLTIALLLYWAREITLVAYNGDITDLAKGWLIKLVFTILLIRAIKSAANAERLNAQIDRVFE